ncbi:MAG: HlyD family efflux transporter periplasmic adaptor subunit, partial [Chlamydiales bacterium]|nr:HlyD family efflux transporter periplasmic adaptor subunit [Chlamydiales bacterium]
LQDPITDVPPNHSRTKLLWLVSGILVVITACCIAAWLLYFQFHETTDDAYANGNLINVNSSISGSVIAFYADDTDLVMQGQLIAQLDPTEFKTIYEQELAKLAAQVLQVQQLYENVDVAKATVQSAKIEVIRTRYDYKNRLALKGTGAVSKENFIHSRDAFRTAKVALQLAKAQLEVAKAAVGSSPIEEHPIIEEQKGAIRTAYYNLAHCSIFAPTTGYIAQRAIDVGQWITPTRNMMAIIPTNYVWVDANFKETQLTYMRIGQPATVILDIYGSKVPYTGKVIGIASGTGSVFSIIPPQNATGNWIKIVQRLPVRISLDPETLKNFPVRLGLSATVDVDISNTNLPMLATAPSTKPVASTNVFNIHIDHVNTIMDEIIYKALHNPTKL